jgi:hypothetical protein
VTTIDLTLTEPDAEQRRLHDQLRAAEAKLAAVRFLIGVANPCDVEPDHRLRPDHRPDATTATPSRSPSGSRRWARAKYQNDGDPRTSGPGFGLTVHPDALEAPLTWRKPRRVFVNSMSDLFHPDVPDDFIVHVWDVMAEPLSTLPGPHQAAPADGPRQWIACRPVGMPAPERLAGHVDRVRPVRVPRRPPARHARRGPVPVLEPLLGPLPSLDLTGIDWVIVGGESGPGARRSPRPVHRRRRRTETARTRTRQPIRHPPGRRVQLPRRR